MMIRISLNGNGAGDTRLSLENGEFIVGRSGSDLTLKDRWCSKKHAVLYRAPDGRVRISDLGSRNGTFLNGEKVRSAELFQGDRIRIGRTFIEVVEVHNGANAALSCGGGPYLVLPAADVEASFELEKASHSPIRLEIRPSPAQT